MTDSRPGKLGDSISLASHSTFSPLPEAATQTARLPSKTVSVSGPA